MARVVIVGGGVIGLCSAYYLAKAGHRVTVIEQNSLRDGCSFGNAGMVVPSHIVPLAAPGMIHKGVRWMFDATSPFYVRPRPSVDLLKWGYYFYRHATDRHVKRAAPALKELSLFSKAGYCELAGALPFDFGYEERGLLMLYKSRETALEEMQTAELARAHGLEAQVLDAREVQALEPDVKVDALGGVYFPGDAHLAPQLLMNGLLKHLPIMGVRIVDGATVENFEMNHGQLSRVFVSNGEAVAGDEFVVATGSWSGTLLQALGIYMPMQAGKGYSFTLSGVARNVRVPSILLEARVAVTPMGADLRFGGTMEIAGVNHQINMNRVRGIVRAIPKYYPEMDVPMPAVEKVWHGLRPCSPDGLPYLGRSKKIANLVIATGHAMMGLSLGPGTGKLVTQLVARQQPSVDLALFTPERFV
jgi:D-amino-acid dehydrogenase